MTSILAHRGNTAGPCPSSENRLKSIRTALAQGWGVETDIRRAADGRFYISHDPRMSTAGLDAARFCEVFREYPDRTVAINIKELGDEAELLEFLEDQGVLSQVFLFDMELIETRAGETARRFRDLHPFVHIAARVSDRGESIERALAIDTPAVIWLDEFDGQWATARDVRQLKQAGRTVYAVSPDLHRYPRAVTRRRWTEFCLWGVDGICTDYPADLDRAMAADILGAIA